MTIAKGAEKWLRQKRRLNFLIFLERFCFYPHLAWKRDSKNVGDSCQFIRERQFSNFVNESLLKRFFLELWETLRKTQFPSFLFFYLSQYWKNPLQMRSSIQFKKGVPFCKLSDSIIFFPPVPFITFSPRGIVLSVALMASKNRKILFVISVTEWKKRNMNWSFVITLLIYLPYKLEIEFSFSALTRCKFHFEDSYSFP